MAEVGRALRARGRKDGIELEAGIGESPSGIYSGSSGIGRVVLVWVTGMGDDMGSGAGRWEGIEFEGLWLGDGKERADWGMEV